MPAAETPLLDIRQFITAQRGERFRTFVVHGAPLNGKSTFARHLADKEGGVYIDVLEHVASDAKLAARVDELDVPWLAGLVRQAAASGTPLVVVDEFEFLIPVWGGDLKPWEQMVRQFYTETSTVVAWVLSSRREVDEMTLRRPTGENRVLKLEEIQQI